MANQPAVYYTPAELADIARRYLPRRVTSDFNGLRIQAGVTVENPIYELRQVHEPIAEIVTLAFEGVRQMRKAGLDPSVSAAACNLIVDEAVEVLHLWHGRIQELGNQAFAKLQEERTAANPQDESVFQAYALRRWPQFETLLNAGRSLPEILLTVTDRKDCRVLREGYPAWYQAKHGLTGFDAAVADMHKAIDQAEERFMSDREKKIAAKWQEVEVGLQRMQTAFSQALTAITRCRDHEPSRTPIPLWMPSPEGENVVWVE
ncbi:hypothetical protein BECAL_02230 [Bellilinea caldifistulae]|uniref:Uncharacterized protein n=1 Tax=Bellilinea caldifistulae TaxID=360411 RepID=A0A0P6XNV8_9CHLR|nr:hypothetical protein [Bellilinea caldifistulae]KPL73784.1 hypothetical protein AC812_13360 [Bellilinea caldifistulae]GAP11048.1 hypothetical protein BECAL_02230 [Bellilinea caldifistulae]